MPFYEYRCQSCGHELEALQKISDEPLIDCPECETAALRRLVSAAAFRLKGSGWYETDFKTGSKRNVAGDEAADGKKKSADGDGKSGDKPGDGGGKADAKPAKAAETKVAKSSEKAAPSTSGS